MYQICNKQRSSFNYISYVIVVYKIEALIKFYHIIKLLFRNIRNIKNIFHDITNDFLLPNYC